MRDKELEDWKEEREKVAALRRELESLKDKSAKTIQELETENKTLTAELRKLRETESSTKADSDSKTGRMTDLTIELEVIASKYQLDMQKSESEISRLAEQIRHLQDSVLKEKSKAINAKSELDSAELELTRLKDRNKSLENEIHRLKSQLNTHQLTLDSRLASSNEMLKKLAMTISQNTSPCTSKSHRSPTYEDILAIVHQYKADLASDHK